MLSSSPVRPDTHGEPPGDNFNATSRVTASEESLKFVTLGGHVVTRIVTDVGTTLPDSPGTEAC